MGAFLVQNAVLKRMTSSRQNGGDSNSQRDPMPEQGPLRELVKTTCQHPHGSARRQRGMTKLIRQITPRLWHTADTYYADALQQTWIYFCRNLCEATTGRAYDPEVASPVTWLNAYLKRRLQDFQIAENRQRATTISQSSLRRGGEDGPLDPLDFIAAPPDIPAWLEQMKAWAQIDANGELASTHVSKHPEVTAQLLILKRLPPETPWKVLSADYGISVGTLSSFYQRQCLTRLRTYGKSQGYL